MPSFAEAFDALKSLTNYETMVRPPYGGRAMNLPRTRALLASIGRPEREFPVLQVAGTKGKGTTATALAAMLRAAGHRTGLYTSPHLFHVRERIAVDGEWIGEADFASGVAAMLPHVTPLRGTPRCPTFFELVTCLALLHFARAGVTAAVLEVGLGGRLDATSAVRPLVSVITHVGLDHTAVLGRTLTAIAAEKAGVAKRNVPLLSGVPAASAAGRTIARVAAEAGAPLLVAGRDFRIRTGRPVFRDDGSTTPVRLHGPEGPALDLAPAVLGRHLARDVALAAAALRIPRIVRRLSVGEADLRAGAAAISAPGRIQVVSERPFVVVDGAHNPDSARALVDALREALSWRRVFAVLGGGNDKDVPGTARTVAGLARRVRLVFTRPEGHPRAAPPEEIASRFRGARVAPDLAAALALVRGEAGPDDLILVTGSLYLAGEALAILSPSASRGYCAEK